MKHTFMLTPEIFVDKSIITRAKEKVKPTVQRIKPKGPSESFRISLITFGHSPFDLQLVHGTYNP